MIKTIGTERERESYTSNDCLDSLFLMPYNLIKNINMLYLCAFNKNIKSM